ncbi:MAG: hypothetical protein U0996_16380 [Planctomycetaceae bacterium]
MIETNPTGTDRTPKAAMYTVRRGDRCEQWTYETLFDYGHRLLMKGKYDSGAAVFAELASAKDYEPKASVFLAWCHAMRDDYAGSSATLSRALPRDMYGDVASRLHDLFVLWRVGLFLDVKKELTQLAAGHPELPSLCLLLGDLLKTCGADRLSRRFYRKAIELDRPDGAISRSADSLLKHSSHETSN